MVSFVCGYVRYVLFVNAYSVNSQKMMMMFLLSFSFNASVDLSLEVFFMWLMKVPEYIVA